MFLDYTSSLKLLPVDTDQQSSKGPDHSEALSDKLGRVRSGVCSSDSRAKLRSLQHRARVSVTALRKSSPRKDVESSSHLGILTRSLLLEIRSFKRLVIARCTHSTQISRSKRISNG